MKQLIAFLISVVFSYALFAQVPQKMTYQAVIRDASNKLISNASVKMRISILKGGATGIPVYSELHAITTNANGLVTVEIGGGTSTSGTFSSIDWGDGIYFLKTETDVNNGSDFSIVGASQLMSVPYAMYAANSGNGLNGGTVNNQIMYWNGTAWVTLNPGIKGQTLTICDGGLTWTNGGVCPPTDASGNTYATVAIGFQVWMAENLRTTKYSDGSNIPVITDGDQWTNNYINNTTLPMMCWYNNDSTTYAANKFGALYNWYAINPSTNGNKNVCPAGWHVPTDEEWTTLITFLGGTTVAGGKMKSVGTEFWTPGNTGATNSSGFTGFPGGSRFYDGVFNGLGKFGLWWSSTEIPAGAWLYFLESGEISAGRNNTLKTIGLSVRCLRD